MTDTTTIDALVAAMQQTEMRAVIESLVKDFVFADRCLEDHPMLRAAVFGIYQRSGLFIADNFGTPHQGEGLNRSDLVSHALGGSHILIRDPNIYFLRGNRLVQVDTVPRGYPHVWMQPDHALSVPLWYGRDVLGAIAMGSSKYELTKRHLDLAILLATVVSYVVCRSRVRGSHPASVAFGRALQQVRGEVGLTQQRLGDLLSRSRITISRWESGAQPPTVQDALSLCRALGVLSVRKSLIVSHVDVTPELLALLRARPDDLRQLSPEAFEQFVAGRLDRMGFNVVLTGATRRKDGGVDLVATPKVWVPTPFLLAAQVKHHAGNRKTGRAEVAQFLEWRGSQFNLGLMVTNTEFTKDAKWLAAQERNRAFLRLRDFADLKRWLEDNFTYEENWREIPRKIELIPGVTVAVPRPGCHLIQD